MTLTELLDAWAQADVNIRQARINQHGLEVEIRQLMHEARAELAESTLAEATYRPAVEWDRGVLAGLAEVMPPDEFVKILTAPKEPVVDARLAVKLAKRGEPYNGIVERARKEGPPELKVTRKDPTP